MKTLLAILMITFTFSSFSFAADPVNSSSAFEELTADTTSYMSAVYQETTGEDVVVQAGLGLNTLKSENIEAAADMLNDAFGINSSDGMEQFIFKANAHTVLPVFSRSKCCECGDCKNH